MPLLQTTVSSLAVLLAVWTAFTLASAVVGVAANAVIQRLPDPTTQYRRFYGAILFPLAVVAFVALVEVTFPFVMSGAIITEPPGIVVTIAVAYLEMLAAGGVYLAGYAPTIRGLRAVRDIEYSTATAVRDMARFIAGLCVPFALIFAGIIAGASTVTLIAGIAIALLGLYIASPWFITLTRDTRPPDPETAERIDTLADRVGLDVRDVRLFQTAAVKTATATVRGVSGYRRLFLDELFLDVYDDDTAVALLAIQAGSVRARAILRKVAPWLLVLLSLLGPLLGGPLWLLLLLPVAPLAWLWLVPRGVRVADDYAARQVGADAVADAMVASAEYHDIDPPRHSLPKKWLFGPGLGDRIERLRARE